MIYIYDTYLSEDNHKILLQRELSAFPFDFVERLKRYRRWQDIQLSLLGRVLLFKGIKEHYQLNLTPGDIKYNQYNKPFFEGNQIYFNISHSGEIVVCAITDKLEIGIDIEKINVIDIHSFKFQMTDRQWDKITLDDDVNEAFFNYWTQKEAVIKASGLGQIDFHSFEIVDNFTIIGKEKFCLKEIKLDKKYKCNIAHKNHLWSVVKKTEYL